MTYLGSDYDPNDQGYKATRVWQKSVMDCVNDNLDLDGCCHQETVCEAIRRLKSDYVILRNALIRIDLLAIDFPNKRNAMFLKAWEIARDALEDTRQKKQLNASETLRSNNHDL